MTNVRVQFLSGDEEYYSDCESVGDLRAAIAISRETFAPFVVILSQSHDRSKNSSYSSKDYAVLADEDCLPPLSEDNHQHPLVPDDSLPRKNAIDRQGSTPSFSSKWEARDNRANLVSVQCVIQNKPASDEDLEYTAISFNEWSNILSSHLKHKDATERIRRLVNIVSRVYEVDKNEIMVEAVIRITTAPRKKHMVAQQLSLMKRRKKMEEERDFKSMVSPQREPKNACAHYVISTLVQCGLDVNTRPNNGIGSSMLFVAAEYGQDEFVSALLEAKATASMRMFGQCGRTPLSVACQYGFHDIVCQLLKYQDEAVAEVRRSGGSSRGWEIVGPASMVNQKGQFGRAPLLLAAHHGHLEVCKALIGNGANVNIKDRYKQTPLIVGAYHGYAEICDLLLQSGAIIEDTDDYNNTAMKLAVRQNHPKVISVLQEHTRWKENGRILRDFTTDIDGENTEHQTLSFLCGL